MDIRIKKLRSNSINVRTRIATSDALNVISGVDISNVQDGYVLMYDGDQQRYIFVNPDTVLEKSVEDGSIPQQMVDKLDQELDNKINLDGGNF